jgi:hypothetical protein
MQNAQTIIDQIDALSKQNNTLTSELNDLKTKLQQMQSQSGGQGSGQSSGQNSGQNPGQNSGQNGGQNGGLGGGQGSAQGSSQASGKSGGQSGADPTARIAGELKQLKGMVQSLETKMSGYISTQTGSSQLNQADIVNLLLTVMDGMIDWSVDYVSSQSSGNQSHPVQ